MRLRPGDGVRLIGGCSLAGSGIAFLVSVGYLIVAEGPGAPDILSTLASPNGRGLLVTSAAAGIVASVLYVTGAVALHILLREVDEFATLVVLVLAPVAAAAFVALLALQYALAQTAQEGSATTEVPFRQLVVQSHSFADAAGWTGIALLALSAVITSWTFRAAGRWRLLWIAGFALAPVWLVLHLLDSGYAFLVPFALWELAVGAVFVGARSLSPGPAAASPPDDKRPALK